MELKLCICPSGHPNVKAFVTHGGMGGSSETIHCGVPAVVTPMYGDQVSLMVFFLNPLV